MSDSESGPIDDNRREARRLILQDEVEAIEYEVDRWSERREEELELEAQGRRLSNERRNYLEGLTIIIEQQRESLINRCERVLDWQDLLDEDQRELMQESLRVLEDS